MKKIIILFSFLCICTICFCQSYTYNYKIQIDKFNDTLFIKNQKTVVNISDTIISINDNINQDTYYILSNTNYGNKDNLQKLTNSSNIYGYDDFYYVIKLSDNSKIIIKHRIISKFNDKFLYIGDALILNNKNGLTIIYTNNKIK